MAITDKSVPGLDHGVLQVTQQRRDQKLRHVKAQAVAVVHVEEGGGEIIGHLLRAQGRTEVAQPVAGAVPVGVTVGHRRCSEAGFAQRQSVTTPLRR